MSESAVYHIAGAPILDARSTTHLTLLAVQSGVSYLSIADSNSLHCVVLKVGEGAPDTPDEDTVAETLFSSVGPMLSKEHREGWCCKIADNFRATANKGFSDLDSAVDDVRDLNRSALQLTDVSSDRMDWAAAWHAVLTSGGPVDRIYVSENPVGVEAIRTLFVSIARGFDKLEEEK